ncbi:MAG TPA: Stk1 family PASTA domain-containing Ser/Thr kinase [Propionibacteriaceae bacterium]|nr:Stk1 family PASTA domain-containing Ser/Thr kinase [Propionibacteriaceae bacterium]
MTAEQGTLLGGRYQLGPVLGRGGMAEVRRALDTRLSRSVAIKMLRIDLAGDATFQARFRREAQAAAGLNHPNIVSVYDTGEQLDPASDVHVPYIVMELVVGHTLRDVLREGRKILPERALEMTMGVLDALQYSHQAGIIHRDIKPANVMLTSTGQVKVMDFGIARAVADTSASMTQTAAVIGTAQYLSPEQARGETVDNRSDVYAAGCLLYELLVGEPPFKGDSPVSVAYQHVRELPVRPSLLDSVITPEMDAITLKALEKDPDNRYQSAKEMRDDIGRLLAGVAPTAHVPARALAEAPIAATALAPVVEPVISPITASTGPQRALPLSPESPQWEPRGRRNRTGLIAGIIAGVVLLGAMIGFAVWWNSKTPAVVQVPVPQVLSMTQKNAEDTLTAAKLHPVVKTVQGANDASVNTVVDQNPTQGNQVPQNSDVTITVNVGPAKLRIPTGLTGQNKDAVNTALQQAGFTKVTLVAATSEPPSSTANSVISINPAEGAEVVASTPITVTYATGQSAFPYLIGLDQATATQKAKDAGFNNIAVKTVVKADQQAGTVVNTDPVPNTMADRSKQVTIYVATAPSAPASSSGSPSPSPSASKS